MTEPIQNLSAFAATGKSKIEKNHVDMSDRKKLKDNVEFKQDKKITPDEYRMLKKEFGMDEAQVKQWLDVDGGQDFLEAMLHAEGATKKEIKANREQIAKEFLMKDVLKFGGIDPGLQAQLKEFGVDATEIDKQIADNIMDNDYPVGTITPDPSTGNTTVEKFRIHFPKDINGNTGGVIQLFDADLAYEDNPNATDDNPNYKGSLLLDKETGMYVKYNRGEGEENQYYRLNGDSGLVEVSKATVDGIKADLAAAKAAEATTEATVEATAATEPTVPTEQTEPVETEEQRLAREAQEKAAAADATKSTFTKVKSVTVDSTGSKQKLWYQDVRETGVRIRQDKGFAENGLPKEIGIELPSGYGQKTADGVQQKRYQNWVLLDAEKGIYGDRAGIRKFQASIDEEGKITFKQIEIDDAKVKAFLNKNAEIAAAKAKENLNEDQTKFKELSDVEAKNVMTQLADRNKAWETYLQVGTENGYLTGAYGLFEELTDEHKTTGIKNYNDLKPALDGLLSRVPEDIVASPEYKAVADVVAKMQADPDKVNKHARDLDKALINLAKTHLAGGLQGANYANNSYLVGNGAAGKVTIQPDKADSMWKTDAKFTIGGQNYYFYRDDFTYDKCYDFQDVVGHETANRKPLITNDVTGNNRQGEITFHADRLEEGKNFYFQAKGGAKVKVTVDAGVAYLTGADGKKVPVNDVLNGKVPMPS